MIQSVKFIPISAKQANDEMSAFMDIKVAGNKVMSAVFDAQPNDPPDDVSHPEKNKHPKKRGKKYHEKTFNAFFFDREEVLKFFYGKGGIPAPPTGSNVDPAEGILLLLGCHDKDEPGKNAEEGAPTMILAGVRKIATGPSNGKYRTIDPSFSMATTSGDIVEQYPPQTTQKEFKLFDASKKTYTIE